MKSKNKNRIWSFILSAMLSIEQIAFAMPSISKATDSAKNTGTVLFPSGNDAAQLIHDDNLVDNGDGTFTFTSKISAQYSYSDVSKSRLQTADGFYPFEKVGKYLIELWGGDGGDGGRALLSGRNGLGGQGGFVYGTLDVTQEMVTAKSGLRYEIGSKGESKTYDMSGGGSAGEGGGAGEIALVSVGAGGGYSAVYLVDSEDTPLGDKDTYSVYGRDDPSKVLMIAGGGGGGAAGANGFHLTALILKMHGDGGDGGSKDSSIYATPAIGNFNTGTYYAGENGTSSGGKTSYVGQGGTDRPEGLAKTTIGFMTASTYANDWQMTYHPDMDTPRRGVGGAGNLHGGGGGAGFAGGGGGIQNVIIDANNVGGGGGGSSYVAANGANGGITGFTAFDSIIETDQYKDYFVEREDNTNKDTGGAIVIRYLEDKDYYDYLDDVNIAGTVSDYFDVVTAEKSVNGGAGLSIKDDNAPNNISFSGSIAPYDTGLTMGQPKDTLTLTLKLKPKDGFAGGKNVPIFTVDENNMAFTCTEVTDSVDKKSCKFLDINNVKNHDEKDVSHVNVKLNVDYSTNSLVKGIGDNYTAAQLKNTPVSYDSTNKMHDFITDINYEVLDKDNEVFNSSYTVQSSDKDTIKEYTVKATITPKSNQKAKVGDAGSGIIEKTAKVKCVEESPLEIDGFNVYAKKLLSYNETYDLDLDLKFESKPNTPETNKSFYVYEPIASVQENYNVDDNSDIPSTTYSNVKLSPGYYYIEAWSGDGGKGDNTYLNTGGSGGKGVSAKGYLYLDSETIFEIIVGKKGAGDGDSHLFGWGGGDGQDGADTKIISGTTTYISVTGGKGGKKAAVFSNGNNGANGTITENTLDSSIDATQVVSDSYIELGHQSSGNGAVRITKLGVKGGYGYGTDTSDTADAASILSWKNTTEGTIQTLFTSQINKNFEISEVFSEYFDVSACTVVNDFDSTGSKTITDQNVKINVKLPATSIKVDEVPVEISPLEGYTTTKTTYNYKIEANGTVKVKLNPKDGFLGGNDVPLLDETENDKYNAQTNKVEAAVTITHHDTTTDSDDVAGIPPDLMTDYANVTIEKDGIGFNDSPSEIIVDYGGTIQSSDVSGKVKTLAAKYPNSSDSWKYDFVQLGATTFLPTEPFTEDGICSVVGVLSSDDAEKAVVIPSVSPAKNSAQIPVKVRYTVSKTLTNLNSAQSCLNGDTPSAITGDKFTRDDIHDAYVLEITPPAYVENGTNYDLPDASAVTVTYDTNNNTVSAADVSKVEGKLVVTIPASAFTDNITITADGVEQNEDTKHKVKYYYEVYDPLVKNVNNGITYVSEDGGSYSRGQEIDEPKPFAPVYDSEHPEEFPDGYTSYYWTWGDNKLDSDTHVMGDNDVYVVGRYVPETYKLRVKYYLPGATEPFYTYTSPDYTDYDPKTDTYDFALTKGVTFLIKSPEKTGYTPIQAYVSGIVDDDFIRGLTDNYINGKKGKEIRVDYEASSGNLNIYQIECDKYGVPTGNSSVVHDSSNISIDTSTHDIIRRSKLNRITPELPADPYDVETDLKETDTIGTEGTYYIYYREKYQTVDVEFHQYTDDAVNKPANVTIDSTSVNRKVAKGMEYGYNPDKDTYTGLPRAVATNYLFDGWYTEGGQLITEDMIVPNDSAGTIKLYAHWTSAEIEITINYKYAYSEVQGGGEDIPGILAWNSKNEYPSATNPLLYGMSYRVPSPVYDSNNPSVNTVLNGYTPDQAIVTGVALKDDNIPVYYSQNPDPLEYIMLRVNVYSESNRSAPGSDTPKSANNKLSGGKFALYDSTGTTRIGTIKESDGTVSWTSVEAAIAADGTYKLVCEDPPTGYGATSRNVELRTVIETKTEGGKTVNIYAANIFLDKSPFQLPMAGSTPMTGYTVFGISAMLLAGLLMFAYVNSRTEENNEKE